jgi:uncharacterized protein YunC (DUF1805 family)
MKGLKKIIVEPIKLEKGVAFGVKVELEKAPLLLIKAEKGFVMCGYLNVAAANSLGEVAARVSGVASFEDVLDARVIEVSNKAKELGITVGMTGREALEKMF